MLLPRELADCYSTQSAFQLPQCPFHIAFAFERCVFPLDLPQIPGSIDYHIPAWIHETEKLPGSFERFVSTFEAEGLDFVAVVFAEGIDLLAGDWVATGDGRLERGEGVEGEEVSC